MAEHLIRKAGGRYYFRRRVPVELVAAVGKVEIQQALGTSDPKDAAKLVRKVSVETDEMFERLRSNLTAESGPSNPSRPWPAFSQHEADAMEDSAYELAHPTESEEQEHDRRVAYAAAQESASEALKRAIRQVLTENGLTPAPYRPAIVTADSAPTSAQESPTKPVAGLIDILPIWQKNRKPDVATVATMHTVISRFHESAGKHPAHRYKRQHVIDFQTALTDKGLAPATIRKNIAMLRSLFATGQDAGLLDDNVSQGVRTSGKPKSGDAKPPFSIADLNVLFSSPVYAEGLRPVQGRGEAIYWLPLLGLFTGARLEELGQLSPADIKEETYRDANGIERAVTVMYITDTHEGQGLKNNASYRRLPIHKELIRLGFLDYVASQSGPRIFPLLRADKYGRETTNFSRYFGMYLREKCAAIDDKKSYHSFRHLFKDICREHGIDKGVRDAIQGHSEGDAAGDYGGQFYPIRPLVEAMARYKLAGVKLPDRASGHVAT